MRGLPEPTPGAAAALAVVADPAAPPLPSLPLAEGRARLRRGLVSLSLPEDVWRVAGDTVPGPGGPVPVRVYRPSAAEAHGALVYLHGGGFVYGDLDTHDGLCRRLANRSGAVVVAVDYRRAPEHRFPAAIEDGAAVLAHLRAHGGRHGVDPARLAVGGDSAGANLALALARDEPVRALVLLCPMLDASLACASVVELGGHYIPRAGTLAWFYQEYTGSQVPLDDPRVSPFQAPVSGLPPTVVVTAGLDPLRDEGNAYARRLAAEGVEVTARCVPGVIHAFVGMDRLIPEAEDVLTDVGAALRGHLGRAHGDRIVGDLGGC